MEINNTAELVTDGTGSTLFLASKSRNQFLQFREMLLVQVIDACLSCPQVHNWPILSVPNSPVLSVPSWPILSDVAPCPGLALEVVSGGVNELLG